MKNVDKVIEENIDEIRDIIIDIIVHSWCIDTKTYKHAKKQPRCCDCSLYNPLCEGDCIERTAKWLLEDYEEGE